MLKVLRIIKFTIIIFLSVVVVCLLIVWMIDLLMTRYSDKLYSPDGAFYAQVDETDGGATTGFNTGVTITNARSYFNISNLLSVRTGDREYVFDYNGSDRTVSMRWLNSRALKITYTDCSKIYGQDQSWKGIKITYEGECTH
jgi:YD repeat-containing protein